MLERKTSNSANFSRPLKNDSCLLTESQGPKKLTDYPLPPPPALDQASRRSSTSSLSSSSSSHYADALSEVPSDEDTLSVEATCPGLCGEVLDWDVASSPPPNKSPAPPSTPTNIRPQDLTSDPWKARKVR